MAGTVIEYLQKYGDISFREKPLNDVDSLALCQLSYLKFDGMVSDVRHNGPSVTLREIAERPDVDKLFGDVRFEKENRALFEGMLSGRRFRDMKLNCYINLVEKEWETQFSAITFILDDGTLFLAFRGTDETIVGWKEDFNMAFLSPVPGQEYSVKYVNMVTGWLHQPFYIGGHSKGGNLAVYSAMKCAPFVQKRIQKIYSLDGPGFRPEMLKECHYNAIEGKVVKLLPHSSMIGMIFERDIHYRVVESNSHGLLQHDPFSWLVEEDHFVDVGDIYESQKIMNEALKYQGWEYVYGGASPTTSFDCSGYVSWVINHSGWNVGRLGAQGLYNICTPTSNPQPGDLVFFKGTYDTPGVSHCGIYVGDNKMLHCGDPIGYANLNTSYWQSHFYAYGRLP